MLAQYWQNVLSKIYRGDKVKILRANRESAVKEQIRKAKRELKKAIKDFFLLPAVFLIRGKKNDDWKLSCK